MVSIDHLDLQYLTRKVYKVINFAKLLAKSFCELESLKINLVLNAFAFYFISFTKSYITNFIVYTLYI